MQLDDLDREILALLQDDASLTNRALAARVNIHHSSSIIFLLHCSTRTTRQELHD